MQADTKESSPSTNVCIPSDSWTAQPLKPPKFKAPAKLLGFRVPIIEATKVLWDGFELQAPKPETSNLELENANPVQSPITPVCS